MTVPTRVMIQEGVLTARGKFTVRHTDYQIERLSAAVGTVKAANEIQLSFMLVARKG